MARKKIYEFIVLNNFRKTSMVNFNEQNIFNNEKILKDRELYLRSICKVLSYKWEKGVNKYLFLMSDYRVKDFENQY